MNNNQSQAQFGSYNPETGETLKGYMENGQMKFKKYSLWERFVFWWNKPPEEEVFIKTCTMEEKNIFTGKLVSELEGALYKRGDNYYIKCRGQRIYIDSNAYENDGSIVMI